MSIINDNLIILQNKNYVFDLSNLGCIDVMGNKACEFLQGQLSCDVRDVTPNFVRQGAMCNLKGRVLALLDVIDWHGFHLILPNDLLVDTQNSLAKTALLSHITLEPSKAYAIIGFYLQNREDSIPFNANLPDEPFAMVYDDRFCCYHLGQGYYIFMMDKSLVKDGIEPFNTLNQMHNSLAWHTLQLYQHRITIYPSSRGLFLPHRLDLHKQGYLSFDKGCYKGQEIIARMHYRSKPKHEMKLFTFKAEEPLKPGQRLLAKGSDVELGEVVDFSLLDKNTYLLAASVIFDCPDDFRIASPQLL
jgi:tRNA-modifying protein YgfZ